MKICIFIQARYNSQRLKGKALLRIKGTTLLEHVYRSVEKINFKAKIVVLTSTSKMDNKIINLCKEKKISFFRGPLNNVYKRFFLASKKFLPDVFIRINGDSPLIDAKIINKMMKIFLKKKKYHIVTNCEKRSFPKGMSVEIINTKLFLENLKNINDPFYKEHITKYFYKNKKKFRIFNVLNKKKFKLNSYVVDNIYDFNRISKFIHEEI
tara:strand:+ start:33972 stop:34601 length:630 start_codon:yes stop_codon:yes gene_type:complete